VDAVTSASLNRNTANTEGNLQVMAQEIRDKKGAVLFSILVQEPFDPDYSTMLEGAIEQIQNGTLPPLQSQVENLEQYDVVFLGIPVWSNELPPAVKTFLTENDLSGKTIVPFGIHLGSRFGRMIDQIEELCPDAEMLEGFTINAGTANDDVRKEFSEWLDALELP
ncbi:MAG: NAD(P)H-dependent oxidoreductase, partial [Bacteroides sp.]|nr:NAD(P)H-dependent oxidoreductase [Bacteroides sp.]